MSKELITVRKIKKFPDDIMSWRTNCIYQVRCGRGRLRNNTNYRYEFVDGKGVGKGLDRLVEVDNPDKKYMIHRFEGDDSLIFQVVDADKDDYRLIGSIDKSITAYTYEMTIIVEESDGPDEPDDNDIEPELEEVK